MMRKMSLSQMPILIRSCIACAGVAVPWRCVFAHTRLPPEEDRGAEPDSAQTPRARPGIDGLSRNRIIDCHTCLTGGVADGLAHC